MEQNLQIYITEQLAEAEDAGTFQDTLNQYPNIKTLEQVNGKKYFDSFSHRIADDTGAQYFPSFSQSFTAPSSHFKKQPTRIPILRRSPKTYNNNSLVDEIKEYEGDFSKSPLTPGSVRASPQEETFIEPTKQKQVEVSAENIPPQKQIGNFTIDDFDKFFLNDEEAIKKAIKDNNKAFSKYYSPLILELEVYKNERSNNIGFYNKIEEGDKYVVYENPNDNKLYMAIKGTAPTNSDDLRADLNIALTGNKDNILQGIDEDFEILMNKYPNKQFVLTSHSLGSVKASLLLDKFDNNIDKVYMFNLGRQGLINSNIGFSRPNRSEKIIHHHIVGDPISRFNNDDSKVMNTYLYRKDSNGDWISKTNDTLGLTYGGVNYHSLSNFKNKNITDTWDNPDRVNDKYYIPIKPAETTKLQEQFQKINDTDYINPTFDRTVVKPVRVSKKKINKVNLLNTQREQRREKQEEGFFGKLVETDEIKDLKKLLNNIF